MFYRNAVEWLEVVFHTEAAFDLPYVLFQGIRVSVSVRKSTSLESERHFHGTHYIQLCRLATEALQFVRQRKSSEQLN